MRLRSVMRLRNRFLMAALVMVSVVALLPSPAVAASTKVSLVAAGLDSPRGIAFVGNRALVAESGHASGTCFAPPGAPQGFQICIGNSSQISWVNTSSGAHTPLATGFFSFSAGPESIGVSGLSVSGGRIYAQIGITSRELPPNIAIGQQAGDLISVNPSNGSWTTVAQVGDDDFDYTTKFPLPDPAVCGACPGTNEHDANPTGVLATSEGLYVADSGANTLTRVQKNGTTKVVAYFGWRDPNPRNFPSDEVPTCVASADDALWIGTLAGHLFRFEDGKVTQVTPRDRAGNQLLSHVTGCTSRDDGTLYLVNMFGPGNFGDPMYLNGSVVKYNTENRRGSVLADAFHNRALLLPYAAKFGPDGNLYVTAGTVCPADGANPFGSGPNPCVVGDRAGGRVVRIGLSQGGDD